VLTDCAWLQRLKLKCDGALSNFAYNFNLRLYSLASLSSVAHASGTTNLYEANITSVRLAFYAAASGEDFDTDRCTTAYKETLVVPNGAFVARANLSDPYSSASYS